MSLGSMLYVGFKECPCRRVKFRGRGPQVVGERCVMLAGTVCSSFTQFNSLDCFNDKQKGSDLHTQRYEKYIA